MKFSPFYFALFLQLITLISGCSTNKIVQANPSEQPAELFLGQPKASNSDRLPSDPERVAIAVSNPREMSDSELVRIKKLDIARASSSPSQSKLASPQLETLNDLKPANKPVGDLWQRLREGFQADNGVFSNHNAEKLIQRYRQSLVKSPRLIQRVNSNASYYLYFVIEELEKHQMPLEIALVPIIESHYDPFAYSPGRASGLWQFIPRTGKRFNLYQNWWQDQRRDIIAATGAAIKYLLYLHKRFDNDWLLAMAAYNAGQGNVAKAIRHNKKHNKRTDYWSLDLPLETRHYIPKLLAWREIIRNPEANQVTLTPIANKQYFESADAGSQIDLAQAAALADVDIDTIYKLNPAFNRWATDPLPPHNLLVPVNQAEVLRKNLQKLSYDQRMTWSRYIIKPNDSLIKIANQFGITSDLIRKANSLKGDLIHEGKALLIPSASKEEEYYGKAANQRLVKRQQRAPAKNRHQIQHRVSAGESLSEIAQHYKVSVGALASWNQMAPKDLLAVDRKLVIWTNAPKASQPNKRTRKLYYKVKRGDSLSYIASKFNLRITDIKNWNKIITQKYIQPGQLLTLYVALTNRELPAD